MLSRASLVFLISLALFGREAYGEEYPYKRCTLVYDGEKPYWVCKEPPTYKPTASPITAEPTRGPSRGPTMGPTRGPTTKYPTYSPTHSPTKAPTHSPTLANSQILLYPYSPTGVPSAFGADNNFADDACRTQAPAVLSSTNAARCDSWHALLCYNGTTPMPTSYHLQDWVFRWGFQGTVTVYATDGTTVVGTWGTGAGQLFGATGSALSTSIYAAGILPTGARFWTGCTETGLPELANNCQGWTTTSASVSSRMGYANAVGGGWLSSVLRTCDTTQRALCACVVLN